MSEEDHEDEARLYLSALADGEVDELTAEQREVVLRHLATEPEAAGRLAAEVRLRQAVARYWPIRCEPPIRRPESANRRPGPGTGRHFQAAFIEAGPATLAAPASLRCAPGCIWPAAAAAIDIPGCGPLDGPGDLWEDHAGPGPVPASLVADVTHIHVDCSRAPTCTRPPFPQELGDLKNRSRNILVGRIAVAGPELDRLSIYRCRPLCQAAGEHGAPALPGKGLSRSEIR